VERLSDHAFDRFDQKRLGVQKYCDNRNARMAEILVGRPHRFLARNFGRCKMKSLVKQSCYVVTTVYFQRPFANHFVVKNRLPSLSLSHDSAVCFEHVGGKIPCLTSGPEVAAASLDGGCWLSSNKG